VIYILTPMKTKTHPPQTVMLQIMTKAMTRTTLNIKIPTLPKIARKVAKFEKTQLDEKQYIAYEMMACTFLLGLVNDGQDENTKWENRQNLHVFNLWPVIYHTK
jgi:hypothetical protein